MVPNAEVRSGAIPIVVILNAAADLTSVAVRSVEVRIAALNAATQSEVTQSASGDFLNEAVLTVVQGIARDAVLQSEVPRFAASRCVQAVAPRFAASRCVQSEVPRFVASRCVQAAVILCVATRDAMVVLQNDSPPVPAFGVQGVVLVGRYRFALDAVRSVADARVRDVSQFSVPAPVLARLQVVQCAALE